MNAKLHRLPLWVWAGVSVVVHALLAASLLSRRFELTTAPMQAPMTMEAVALERQPPPPVVPEPERQPAPSRPVSSARPAVPKRAAKDTPPREAPPDPSPADGAAPGLAPGQGALAVSAESGGVGKGTGIGAGPQGSGSAPAEPERKQGPAQLSLWIDVDAFTQMALVRPGIALVMAVPGFRDMLRGSGIRPFVDLRQLRVSLHGLAADQLTLAGVHGGGEQALLDVAERIAAMRNRKPLFRGDAELRASAWEDGTGVDRGLAVHGGAFVIAARAALPGLLGSQQPGQQVPRLSSLRARSALMLTVEDASRYLPGVQPCGLQALRASIAASDQGARMALTAYYRAASVASAARVCLGRLDAGEGRLTNLVKWLARAESAPGRNSTSLQIEVTSADIEQLLNELAWALRSA